MDSKINLLFCGDFFSLSPNEICFSDELLSVISSCKIRCIDFEAPVENKGVPINKGGHGCITQSLDSPQYLESMGFNVISMSNNHIYDYGEEGLIATQNAFKSSLICGVGTWDTAYQVKVLEFNNIKIGFLSLTHCEFGVLDDVWDKSVKIGCAGISNPQVNTIITNAKKHVDFVIILAHAGVEYLNIPLPEWRNRYREFIDYGADAVVASHPHAPQGWEKYKDRPIFYSLGNFYYEYNSEMSYWNDGLIVLMDVDSITKEISYKVECIQRINNRLEINSSEKMKKHIQYLCEILKDDNLYMNEVENSLMKLWHNYQNTILSGLNLDRSSLTPKNILRIIKHSISRHSNLYIFINLLRCESHLWAIKRIIKLKQKDIV